jgi:predicted nucleic acid-binding protein
VGELALGSLRQRDKVLSALCDLPQASLAMDEEVLSFIDQWQLSGIGLGYADVHLLASVRLTPGSSLWTRDKRLAEVAVRLDLSVPD